MNADDYKCAYFDKNGYPICKGDVLKVYHFEGPRRKKYYMYKVVTEKNGELFSTDITDMVLHPNNHQSCVLRALTEQDTQDTEIVQGSGPGELYTFEQRWNPTKIKNLIKNT